MTTGPEKTVEPTAEDIADQVTAFVRKRTRAPFEPDTDLFENNGLSSLFATELVMFLEESFDIEIAGRDLRMDNFRTVELMVSLVQRLRESEAGGRD